MVKNTLRSHTAAKRNSSFFETWRRLQAQPVAMICLVLIAFIVIVAIFADIIVDYDDAVKQVAADKLMHPCAEHIFGCDQYGRDMFARIVHGTRIDLLVGICASVCSLIVSVILATCSALFGGKVDMVIMRIVDVLCSVPALVIALAICGGLGNGIWQLIIALTIPSIGMHTKMVRSQALPLASKEFIEASTILGCDTLHKILRHLVPNLASIIIINITASVAQNIMMCATLSFIGLGIKAPMPEWGLMLSEGLNYMVRHPHMVAVPALTLLLTTLCINTFGDYLRDAFDPQLKGRA